MPKRSQRVAPPMAHAAVAHFLPDGRLTFRAPDGSYAGIPAWRSLTGWIGAARLHPNLGPCCRAHNVAPSTLLAVLRELGTHADAATGREIAVSHAVVADALGISTKTVQRAVRASQALDLLVTVLSGCDMSLPQRIAVLGHYARGSRGSKWRTLPNFYAATVPRQLDVHLPERSQVPQFSTYVPTQRTFTQDCGQPQPTATTQRPVAPLLTTTTHLKSGVRPAQVTPSALRAYGEALRALLPGYRALSLARICPGLSLYASAGISPSRLIAGLDGYLAAVGTSWLTDWAPGHDAEQARYLVGMLKRARLAGYIRPVVAPGKA